MSTPVSLLGPIAGAERKTVGGVQLDVVRTGASRVKRVVYPPGFRWSTHLKSIVGTDLCMHAHVGFLAQGSIKVQYEDGCTAEFTAPHVITIEPGHDGWVLGDEAAIVIEFDFERETIDRLGMPSAHRHTGAAR